MSKAWRPSVSIDTLKKRAVLIANIRAFFVERDVLEVETPLMSRAAITNPYIESFSLDDAKATWYLQTSPEFAMKRLLAAGSGPIFQISKAFRKEEAGHYHHPEFTMLEWYRPGFDHHQLMDEMDTLLQILLKTPAAEQTTYQALFKAHLSIDPLEANTEALKNCAKAQGIMVHSDVDRDDWLNLLMTHVIEPKLGQSAPTFVYHYPASQAALSKIAKDDPRIAERFELYYKGIELANGFHELSDAQEQRARFETDNTHRKAKGLIPMPIDEHLLQALEHGLPNTAGVALGVDRLLMLALDKKNIQDVLWCQAPIS